MTLLQFSIIIPTYNRPERLRHCLQALIQMDYPRDDFEVIVVDDGSQMLLTPVIESFPMLPLRLIRQANAGPATARNTGAAMAQGKFLVFTDDDCIPTADWLKALDKQFQLTPNALVGGQTLNALPSNLYSTASQLLIDYLYKYYNHQSMAHFFASNNFALPASMFRQLNGFDTSFPLAAGEDREFCDRWCSQGYLMQYAPEAQVYHAHHLTLSKFWQQHFNYGCGAFWFHQLRAQQRREPIKVEPVSFYLHLLAYPFMAYPAVRQTAQTNSTNQTNQTTSFLTLPLLDELFISGLFFLSQLANVAGFFWQRKNQSA